MENVSVSEIFCECDAVEAMCGVAGQVGAVPTKLNLAGLLEVIAAVRAMAAFFADHPEILATIKATIEAIKRMFGPQPTPTPDNGVV